MRQKQNGNRLMNRNIEDVDAEDIDVSASEDNAAADVNKEATPPPFKQENRVE